MSTKINDITNWFLNSKIYENGAYVAYYNGNKKGPIYPEITGYAISLSSLLYKRTMNPAFLERAVACNQYMQKIVQDGGVPSLTDGLLYVFDTGIYIMGLFDLYDVTRQEIYLKQAEKSLTWMYSCWDGERFKAVNDIPAQREWYHESSVHLAKMSIPLIKASVFLKNSEHEKNAFKLLEFYTNLQTSQGNFQVSEGRPITMSHPHCYATEGFLYAYYHSKNEKYLTVAKNASEWLKLNQNKYGALYRIYPLNNESLSSDKEGTSDATSQSTRIWKLLGVNQPGIDKAYLYLEKQLKGNGLRLLKKDSVRSSLFNWRNSVFSWPTFFYLHSLMVPFGEMDYCRELF
jgi:uncharacterized protein YyaL (SSP411 family)